jgi:hypothetical protein
MWMRFPRLQNNAVWLIFFQLSKRFGFLDTGEDNGGMIAALDHYLRYLSKVGIYHEWHSFLTWCLSFFPNSGSQYLGIFTQEQILDGQKSKPKSVLEKDESKPTDDFLTKTLRMHALQPDKFPMTAVFSTCMTNIGAGSDTTSVSLAGIMYHLMKSPATLEKVRTPLWTVFETNAELLQLRQELDQAVEERGSTEMLSFQEVQKLPYLQAVIKEGLRRHPATGLPMVRVVPKGGAKIAGRFFPEKVNMNSHSRPYVVETERFCAQVEVGVNTWVAHANTAIFGPDAEAFRPERWLEDLELAAEMNRNILTVSTSIASFYPHVGTMPL